MMERDESVSQPIDRHTDMAGRHDGSEGLTPIEQKFDIGVADRGKSRSLSDVGLGQLFQIPPLYPPVSQFGARPRDQSGLHHVFATSGTGPKMSKGLYPDFSAKPMDQKSLHDEDSVSTRKSYASGTSKGVKDLQSLLGDRDMYTSTLNAMAGQFDSAYELKDIPEMEATVEVMDELYSKLAHTYDLLGKLPDITHGDCSDFLLSRCHAKSLFHKAQAQLKQFQSSQIAQFQAPVAPVQQKSSVKLESLVIEPFDGDILKFQNFWSTFKARIHTDRSLSSAEKFAFLVSKLKGSAQGVIHGLTADEIGYEKAYKLLLDRYGKRMPLVNSHISKLMEISVPKVEDSEGLRKLSDALLLHVRCLESLGVRIEGNSQILGPMVLSKLPLELRIRWQERCQHLGYQNSTIDDPVYDPVDVEELLNFVRTQAENRELGVQARLTSSNSRSRIGKPPLLEDAFGTFTTDAEIAEKCLWCGSADHKRFKCQKLSKLSVKERSNLVRQKKRCFNCLGTDHMISNCPSDRACRKCDKKHHTLLCSNEVKKKKETKGPKDSEVNASLMVNGGEIPSNGIHPTLIAKAVCNGVKVKVRVLLDGCSNQSFVCPELVKKLHLPCVGKKDLTVNVFGKGSVQKSVKLHELKLQSLFGCNELDLHAYSIQLCAPLSGKCVPISELKYLQGLDIAENYSGNEPRPIDILLGHDYMYEILSGGFRRGPRGYPVALETTFGWVLHGPYGFQKLVSEDSGVSTHHVSTVAEPSFGEFVDRLCENDLCRDEPEVQWPVPQVKDGRYFTTLPWKEEGRPLSNIRAASACQRHVNAGYSEEFASECERYFDDYLSRGIIEKCAELPKDAECAYLPHRGIRQKGKLRMVFNGSFGKPSMNDLLLTGPNQLQTLPVCVTSFRLFARPVAADIEKAFVQVGIEDCDRDFVRFLRSSVGGFSHYRFQRVPFGLTCSPAVLNSCLQHLYSNAEREHPDLVRLLKRSMYCDDLVTSVADDREFNELQEACSSLFGSVSFNLRGWEDEIKSVLGIGYDRTKDCFLIDLTLIEADVERNNSRRNIVSATAKLFDPMGFVSPCILRCKEIIQKAWVPSAKWDDPLPPEIDGAWRSLRDEFRGHVVQVPRHVGFQSSSTLHVFSDASCKAFACCIYLVNSDCSTLLFSKSRVVSKKSNCTIPRLELCGVLLGCQALSLLRRGLTEFRSLDVFLWTDSSCVLSWLRQPEHSLEVFVRNRVRKIREIVCDFVHEFRHVPGVQNPADVASRGASPSQLAENRLWFHGPPWISNRQDWPLSPEISQPDPPSVLLVASPGDVASEVLFRCFSQLSGLLKFIARCRRWLGRARTRLRGETVNLSPLSHADIEAAKKCLLMVSQGNYFSEEVNDLGEGRRVNAHSQLRRLRPVLEDGLIMGSPRTGEPPLVIVPNKSHVAKLIIWDAHRRFLHAGTDRIIAHIHKFYWVTQIRKLVKSQLRLCVSCRRYQGRSYARNEGFLPPFRVEVSRPFEHTGLDYAGPLQLADDRQAYILLFTCSGTRAVHLELTQDMTFDSTLRAFRRFVGRRGEAKRYYSDNALAFIKISQQLLLPWKFIPERSPWWGGWWERLVGVVKASLRKTLHLSSLCEDELRTVLTELENVVNQRPLTYVSDLPDSIPALSPAHFLTASYPVMEPWVQDSGSLLRSAHGAWVAVGNKLIDRWRHEYLTSLRVWRDARSGGKTPAVGDIVLVREGPRRSRWPLAAVVEVISPFVVKIRLHGKITRRATNLLYPLESEAPWDGLPSLRCNVTDSDSTVAPSSLPDLHDQSETQNDSEHSDVEEEDVHSARVTRGGRVIRRPARFLD